MTKLKLDEQCRRPAKTYARLGSPPCKRCGFLLNVSCLRGDFSVRTMVVDSVEQ